MTILPLTTNVVPWMPDHTNGNDATAVHVLVKGLYASTVASLPPDWLRCADAEADTEHFDGKTTE